MINLQSATTRTISLRSLLDDVEKHLRCLEVLKQNVEQDIFVAMIRAKLPEEVLVQLEMLNGAKNKWTAAKLREKLDDYITAREKAEQKVPEAPKENVNKVPNYSNTKSQLGSFFPAKQTWKNLAGSHIIGSAEALVVNTKQAQVQQRFYDQCRYCEQRHWSDECLYFKTSEERKRHLKDSCYRCLKIGHVVKDCVINKTCVYCGEVNAHHRSLCPERYKSNMASTYFNGEISDTSGRSLQFEENTLISSDEIVLMQTATTQIKNPINSCSAQTRLLLDSGSQRTYITEH